MADEDKEWHEPRERHELGRHKMSDLDGFGRELEIHDPFIIPDELELAHEIKRPRYWYAHQLRLAGATWAEVAESLGYSSAESAAGAVRVNVVNAGTRQTTQEMLDLELERLDMLQLVVWRRARQGDLKSIEAVLKIMQTRAKYLGLESNTYEDEKTDKATILIGGDSESYIEGIKKAQDLHRKPVEGEVMP